MIHDAIKQGDEEFLAEVLEALNKKYNLGAHLKREDREERNICIGEENTNNENEHIMEDPNQVSSEELVVEEAYSEDTRGTQNEEESKESLEKDKVEDENSNSDEHRVEDEPEGKKRSI